MAVNSFQAMAQRLDDAARAFIDHVVDVTGCADTTAFDVLCYFQKHKLVRLSVANGRFYVKHGRLLEKDVLDKACRIVLDKANR